MALRCGGTSPVFLEEGTRGSRVSPGSPALTTRPQRPPAPCLPLCPGLVQRCVIIQKDQHGFGFTVSGDRVVLVQSVRPGESSACCPRGCSPSPPLSPGQSRVMSGSL